MLLAGGQAAEGAHDLLTRQAGGLFQRHAFQHFDERRAAGQRRRAPVGEETRGLYPFVAQAQSEAQSITADRVGSLGRCVCVRQFSGMTRVGQVVFESF